ncbi:MAG TPA: alpha/beta fold hydrolase [Egibacteraceae bacterium]|nr:alpha/beta fold hydrolase [Egibacteraceae bacterium]
MTSTTTVDGRAATYLEAGSGPGRPLLLVHGYTGSKEDFEPVLRGLGERRRVIAVDLPGHGGSPGSDDPGAYALGPTSAWVLAFADSVGLDDFHLLGHSMGGLVVQRVAAAASQRLLSLTLMATGMGAVRDEAAEHLTRMALAARDHGVEAAWAAGQQRPPRAIEPPTDPARDAFVRRRFRALSPAALVGGARNLVGAAPLGAFLRGIDVPVLVIHGEHDDAWLPSEQAELARITRGARYVVVPDAVHSPQLENAEYWLKAVTSFLDDAETSHRP